MAALAVLFGLLLGSEYRLRGGLARRLSTLGRQDDRVDKHLCRLADVVPEDYVGVLVEVEAFDVQLDELPRRQFRVHQVARQVTDSDAFHDLGLHLGQRRHFHYIGELYAAVGL